MPVVYLSRNETIEGQQVSDDGAARFRSTDRHTWNVYTLTMPAAPPPGSADSKRGAPSDASPRRGGRSSAAHQPRAATLPRRALLGAAPW